jgi:hypothetical protein
MNYELKIKNLILFLIIAGFLLPSFCLSQTSGTAGPPQNFGEIKTMGLNALKFIPQTLAKIWQEGITWLKKIWQSYIYPFLHKIWQKIDSLFGKEIEERKPIIKEELKKETEEMKKEVPLVTKSLWEKLKGFFKF